MKINRIWLDDSTFGIGDERTVNSRRLTVAHRLKAKVNFKTGTGRMFDPETGRHYDNFLIDWGADHQGNIVGLEFHFTNEDLVHVEDPWELVGD